MATNANAAMLMRSALLRHQAGRRLSSEHAGWAEGPCLTSRRNHKAVLRVIVLPPAGALALYHHGRCGFKGIDYALGLRSCERINNIPLSPIGGGSRWSTLRG